MKSIKKQILSNTRQLMLVVDKKWSQEMFELLSALIDFECLTEMWLIFDFHCILDFNTINSLLKIAYNIHSFGISIKTHEVSLSRAQDISAMIPYQIKHLKVVTKNVESIKLILEQVEHLSRVTFYHRNDSQSEWSRIVEWLKTKEKTFKSQQGDHFLQIWFH